MPNTLAKAAMHALERRHALAHPFFFPLSTKSVAAENHRKSLQEPKAKRLSSIPDMSSVDAMNAREVSGGVGERFTFEHGRK